MASDGTAELVIGVRITKADFFTKSKPNDALMRVTDRINGARGGDPISPRHMWDYLMNGITVLGFPNPMDREIGIYGVGALESSTRASRHLALGFRIYQEGDSRGANPVNALPLKTALLASDCLQALLADCFPKREVELFLTFCWWA